MSQGPKKPEFPNFKRHPTGPVDPVGPSFEELRARSRAKNFDQRFNSPFGFHEPNFKKRWVWERHPRAFMWSFVFVSCSLYFSRPIYIALFEEHSPVHHERAHFLKQQMIKQGLWDPPFISNLFTKDGRSKEE